MRIAVIQLAYGDGDTETVDERVARVTELVRTHGAGHDLVLLPELWTAGCFAVDDWEDRALTIPEDGVPEALLPLAEVTREIGAVLHTGSVVERSEEAGPEGRHLWNTSIVLGPDGMRLATYRKIHRFGFGQGEPKHMEAGTELVVTDLPAPADALTAGLSTCYDLRFPELYRRQLDSDASLFIIPAAWPTARVAAWTLLGQARAIENQCFVLACNTAGTHGGVEMGGHSQVVAPTGAVLATAGSGEEILDLVIDLDDVARARSTFPVLSDRRL